MHIAFVIDSWNQSATCIMLPDAMCMCIQVSKFDGSLRIKRSYVCATRIPWRCNVVAHFPLFRANIRFGVAPQIRFSGKICTSRCLYVSSAAYPLPLFVLCTEQELEHHLV
jgi:hypothetical protein